jgi:N-methylhydantoinase A
MSYQVCIDIGGTFTDALVADASGDIRIFKAPTTPGAFHQGFMDVLQAAAEGYGQDLAGFLGTVEIIVHGSTVATNALVEGKIARTGLIVNEGHRDVLLLREGPRKGAFEWRLDYPDAFVPRHLTRTARGRIDARGRELEPLAEDDVRDAVAHFKRQRVGAIAVGLLWSIANGDHERRARAIIREEWPQVPVTLSHELNPIPREYRRIISAAIDAALYPIVSDYIRKLHESLEVAGFTGQLLMANCVGGMMPPDEMTERPIYSVMSGPTLAPIAAQALTDEADVIVGDMGGTTFDVSALRDRQLIVTPEARFGHDMLGIPKVDVRSIGAGGGSIAWVDPGGLLHVGPQSAGAVPGPACYGAGGSEPTVTDANVVLGIIDPDYFLGGRMKLDRALAEQAVGKIAAALGIGLIEAAYSIHTTSNHNMVTAIEDITIREGINPRESYFVSGGGGTACHIAEMADVLSLRRYMMPKFAAGLSAFGGLICDLRSEASATRLTDDRRFDLDGVNAVLGEIHARGAAFLERARVPAADRSFEYSFMGRYLFQSWEIAVPFELPAGRLEQADVARLTAAFHAMHDRIYSIKDEADVVEFTSWKVVATGRRARADTWKSFRIAAQAAPLRPKSRRPVYIHGQGGLVATDVFDGADIGAGARLAGPCVIEEATFTALLLPGHAAEVDAHGNYLVEVSGR